MQEHTDRFRTNALSGRPVVLHVEFLLARILYTRSLPKEVAAKWSREGGGVGREIVLVCVRACVRVCVDPMRVPVSLYFVCVCVCERERERERGS